MRYFRGLRDNSDQQMGSPSSAVARTLWRDKPQPSPQPSRGRYGSAGQEREKSSAVLTRMHGLVSSPIAQIFTPKPAISANISCQKRGQKLTTVTTCVTDILSVYEDGV
jgi:hypothetical protein